MLIGRAAATVAILALAPADAAAVRLNPEGLGQALIYPYYTVRAMGGNAFNTYLSVVNHAEDAKALRMRFREGRNGREALGFNLYLAPGDAWAGAVVPTAAGARLVSVDRSCTDPVIPASGGLEFTVQDFSGTRDDGAGDTADRAREGFVEILEMATLFGESAGAVSPRGEGVPPNCVGIRSTTLNTSAPTGGLSGTLTLINVASGLDFTLGAEALAELSTQAFFRPPSDPYPDFAAAEITPVSIVIHEGHIYRSLWPRGLEAVSAVLMRTRWGGEYVLDSATLSLTDVVLSLPTRHFHTTGSSATAPFTWPAKWEPACLAGGEPIGQFHADRHGRVATAGCPNICPAGPAPVICAGASVGQVENGHAHTARLAAGSATLGSTTLGLRGGEIEVVSSFENGWFLLFPSTPVNRLSSLPGSQRIDGSTGAVQVGTHVFQGLPALGFTVRTFGNGTLQCTGGACQGNYGSAFPLQYERTITP